MLVPPLPIGVRRSEALPVKPPRRPSGTVALDPAGSELVSSGGVGRYYKRSRKWGLELLKQWYAEQQAGGVPKVLLRGRYYYTTRAVLYADHPRGRDETVYRKLAALEKDLERAYSRIVELERKIGARR